MLTDQAIRRAKAAERPRKLFDGHGLFLLVSPSGGKWWRLKYRFGGKAKTLSLGVYPTVGLKQARELAYKARQTLARGVDPGAERKAEKARRSGAESFEGVACEWFKRFSRDWTPAHAETVIQRLEKNVFPWLGTRPVGEIAAPELLAVLRRIEARGALEVAHRVGQRGE